MAVELARAVHAAMAVGGTRDYSPWVRQDTSEDRFPAGRSRTPDAQQGVVADQCAQEKKGAP